jgi:diaminohydroxyphosphoribosylaminopyrimidine deaminase/5-amino-6-(5-phosphoribosylamino)uracil reductase
VVAGKGWHDRLGALHAEAMALRDAGSLARGATVYVTLSPCASHGRQPPCADALIAAQVARVIAAVDDPNPQNASGLEKLRQAGIPAVSGLLRAEAEYLARGFFKKQLRHLPYLTLKYAMTLDGKIASITGDSHWVSGEESRELVHDLRSRSDAILIGSGTALADKPRLTVRDPVWSSRGGSKLHIQPRRVIVDSRGRTPPGAALFNPNPPGGETSVAVTDQADPARLAALAAAGARILRFSSPDGRVPLYQLIKQLGEDGANHVLCEGGGELAAGLLAAGLIDEIWAFITPKLIGGREAPGPIGGAGIALMGDAAAFVIREGRPVGGDWLIRAAPA